jgi:hypothetical protein
MTTKKLNKINKLKRYRRKLESSLKEIIFKYNKRIEKINNKIFRLIVKRR